jgi:hypothetical protein
VTLRARWVTLRAPQKKSGAVSVLTAGGMSCSHIQCKAFTPLLDYDPPVGVVSPGRPSPTRVHCRPDPCAGPVPAALCAPSYQSPPTLL